MIPRADAFRPTHTTSARQTDVALVLAGSLFVALSAQVAIRLPFSPVPLTGQTLAVLLVGVLLGSRRGALALLTYLSEGAVGLPVFASGTSGIAYMLGPTGGYLVGFLAAAYVTGLMTERGWARRTVTAFILMVTGNLLMLALGLLWLSGFVGLEQSIRIGLLPFLPGDLIKIALAADLLPSGWRILAGLSSDNQDNISHPAF